MYESVCSFSNRIGGLIILGVEDNGTVIGVNPACAQNMVKNIINVLGNLSLGELGIYTKNPLIVKVLSQLQWVEDLGSGKRNIKIYAPLYYDGYEVSIKSGQQFEFSITYQNPDAVSGQESGGKVGGNDGNSSVVYITERQQIILKAIENVSVTWTKSRMICR